MIYLAADDGASLYDDAPETPAPLFAVRAFKTAIFGTPHPEAKEIQKAPRIKESPAAARIDTSTAEGSSEPVRDAANGKKPPLDARIDTAASPAKGILLTPGTAASRRKTVSFGFAHTRGDNQNSMSDGAKATKETQQIAPRKNSESTATDVQAPRQSTLTRTLIEMSKQQFKEHSPENEKPQLSQKTRATDVPDFLTDSVMAMSPETTMDLSQPRSRSGQHWKTEFDQYHKRSNREIRKIIRHGQNVKSYASKKDTEATVLCERLKRESARVASMEAKVSRLASELKDAQSNDADSQTHQTRLVGELAQQTALAIRYQQRADMYRSRLQRMGHVDAIEEDEDQDDIQNGASTDSIGHRASPPHIEAGTEESAMETLRNTAKAAEQQAARLENENLALKRSLARVKEEMMSYETRRQAREERLKKREAKLKAEKEDSEMRLARLTVEHENLLRTAGDLPVVDMAAEIQSIQEEAAIFGNFDLPQARDISNHPEIQKEIPPSQSASPQKRDASLSPRRRRLNNPTIDIWTLSSPREDQMNIEALKEPIELPPSSVKHDIHRTLKEIDHNLLPQHAPHPRSTNTLHNQKTHPVKDLQDDESFPAVLTPPQLAPTNNNIQSTQYENRRFTAPSPRPSMISIASSPAKLPLGQDRQAYSKLYMATTGRSASLMSRTSTFSRRTSALSAERAAAAKERLARRSADKRSKVAAR